jgi:hypothetical protein
MMTQVALIALIHTCVNSMTGATYNGDPSNLPIMRGVVMDCQRAADDLAIRTSATPKRDINRRELLAIVLDREVILSYGGMNDAATALPAAKAELRTLGELLKVEKDQDTVAAFEAQADLVGGQIQTLETALRKNGRHQQK